MGREGKGVRTPLLGGFPGAEAGFSAPSEFHLEQAPHPSNRWTEVAKLVGYITSEPASHCQQVPELDCVQGLLFPEKSQDHLEGLLAHRGIVRRGLHGQCWREEHREPFPKGKALSLSKVVPLLREESALGTATAQGPACCRICLETTTTTFGAQAAAVSPPAPPRSSKVKLARLPGPSWPLLAMVSRVLMSTSGSSQTWSSNPPTDGSLSLALASNS